MKQSAKGEARYRDWLRLGGWMGLILIALPVFAVLVLIGRFVLLAVAAGVVFAGLVAYAVSPGFRAWLTVRTEPEVSYKGLRFANGLAFHPGHAWARLEGDEATLGADDLVQAALGPVDEVELPAPGSELTQGEVLALLRRDGRTLSVLSPVSGRVLAANESVVVRPELVNRSPFGEGWLARVQSDAIAAERAELYRGAEARAWFRREVDRLLSRLAPGELAPALPDGGMVVGSLHEHIDDIHWTRLAEELFGAVRA